MKNKLDNKKLAVIHIVKKELDLSDSEYRKILKKVTGVDSAKQLDYKGFRKLMNYFVRSDHYRINSFGMTIKQKMFIDKLVGGLGWDNKHLRNFLNKYYGKTDIKKLKKKEASKLIESLKNVKEHKTAKVGN
jgi:uncharacterized protein YydD (DUF2326 family)